MTQRWIFDDDTTTWTVPINPNQMSSPYPSKQRQTMANLAGTVFTLQAPTAPQEWTFGGVIRTQAHHEQLLTWSRKNQPITITDHYGRSWRVLITAYNPEDRRPTFNTPWRMKYTMRTLMLGPVT